jgi:hypothetical protein
MQVLFILCTVIFVSAAKIRHDYVKNDTWEAAVNKREYAVNIRGHVSLEISLLLSRF